MTSLRSPIIAASLSLVAASVAFAQSKSDQAGARNQTEMSFAPIPGVPTCLTASVQKGDPFKTAFIVLAKADAGCVVPWHWHQANEHLMIVGGDATIAMRDQNEGKPVALHAAGFALLPGKHAHEFRCEKACTFYLYSDARFDIHYVDKAGKEIPAAQALEPFEETPAPMPKGG